MDIIWLYLDNNKIVKYIYGFDCFKSVGSVLVVFVLFINY